MQEKTVTLNGELRTLVGATGDDPYWAMIANGHEQAFSNLCNQVIKDNHYCWDIGANIGVTSHIMASRCGAGRVVAVEAGKRNYDALVANVSANGLSPIVMPIHAAAGGYDGQVNFNERFAWGCIAPTGTPTTLISPQTIYEKFSDQKLDFLKIDIEGFEVPFVKSAENMLVKHGCVIYMEFNVWCLMFHGRERPVEFFEWIVEHFPAVYLFDHSESKMLRCHKDSVESILHDVVVKRHAIADLIFTSDPERLESTGLVV